MTVTRRGRDRSRRPVDTSRYRRLENPFEPVRVLSDDHVEHLHRSAVTCLAEHGLRVLLPEARELLRAAGNTVDAEMIVRFDPDHVAAAIASAPSTFTIKAPSPDRDVIVGGRYLATLTLSDKVPFVYARGRQRVRDEIDLVKLRLGIDSDEAFAAEPHVFTNVNVNSPRQLDIPMGLAIIDFARLGQPAILTPFTLAGAMAPVTLAGALVLQHLEALAAITLAQTVRPGTPVVYGAFTSNVDMKSGSPAFGTPEAIKGAYASGQLARHLQIPWRSSGSSASNSVDAQAGYETMMNTFGAVYGGANWIFHAAGWQEGGLTASYEKFIVDVEMCQMIAESMRPVLVDDDELALDAITEVGPGGHFFGVSHTIERFEHAFYQPIAFSRTNYEQWTEEGSQRCDQRATAVWKKVLDDYEPPLLAADTRQAMEEFVARRVAEGGAAPD